MINWSCQGEQDNNSNSDNDGDEEAATSVHSASAPVGETSKQNADNCSFEWSVNISSESEDDAPRKGLCLASDISDCAGYD